MNALLPVARRLIAIACLVVCAASNAAPATTADAPSAAAAMDSRRDIVLAVDNPVDPPPMRAGSNLLAYAPASNYGKGERAAAQLEAVKQRYGLREIGSWPIKALNLYCAVLTPPPGTTRQGLLAELAKDSRIKLAQPLNEFSVYSSANIGAVHYDDPYVDLQRGFVETEAAVAHRSSQGAGVRVAIVDTGVDVDHPDLRGRIHDVHNEVDDDTAAFRLDRHGTEVTGIIAATGSNREGFVGMAPKATISIYKACWYPPEMPDASARCNSFTLAKALAAIIDTDARVVNLSLGGPSDLLLDALLARLAEQGRIIIVASSPDGHSGGFPDSANGVLLVRTSASTPALAGVLNAPGIDILTTQPNGRYDFSSGSSMAAAHVSGIAALVLSIAPRLDADSLRDLLLRHGRAADGVVQVDAADAVGAVRASEASAH
jgi:subtilisin family serine protease